MTCHGDEAFPALSVSLAGFAAAAGAANVAGRAAGPGSPAGRPGPGSVWLAGGISCPRQRRPDASGDSPPGAMPAMAIR